MQKIAPGMLSGMVFCAHNPLKSSKNFACGAANFIGFALLIVILLPVEVCAIRIQRHNYLKLMTTPVVCCTGNFKTQSKLYITQEENYITQEEIPAMIPAETELARALSRSSVR